MLERLGLLAILLFGLVALYAGVQLAAGYRRRKRVNRVHDPSLSGGKPTVLFFTADYCTVCHYRQRPALEDLRSRVDGDLRVVEVDAAADGTLAKRFGVLTLPSTVVLAADGRVGAVNYGFAPSDQLRAQVASVA
jgi:thioredoxin-like negative regulator of GroEL